MRTAAAVVALCLLATAGCTGDGSSGEPSGEPPAVAPAFEEVACPEDVDATILAPTTCGYLTVPENRAEPDRTVRLLVVRVEPPERLHDEPVFVAGTNLGNAPNYGGIAPVAQRLGREAILMDARGIGHSEPSLACPEVEAIAMPSLRTGTTDAATRGLFLTAVSECRQRLEDQGVDLDSYTVRDMAADAADLRRALGIDEWNVHTYGTAARITLEMLRSPEAGIRAAFMDSPEPQQVDPRVEGAHALHEAIGSLDSRCAADPRCARAYGSVAETLDTALSELHRHPLVMDVPGPAVGEVTRMYVDDVMLLRLLRAVLSDGGSSGSLYLPESVPAIVALAAKGRLDELAPLLSPTAAQDTAYCAGYVPKCQPQMALSEGALYSSLCRDGDVAHDPEAMGSVSGWDEAYAEMFGDSPYVEVCSAWGESGQDADPAPPVESEVPALVLVGGFATHNRLSTIREGLSGLDAATFVVNPRAGHNVLIGECMGEIRLRWHEDFTLDRGDLSCLDDRLAWTSEADLLAAASSAGS